MKMLDKSAVVFQIVLTKSDKLKKEELEKIINQTKEVMKIHTACFPDLLVTSSEKKEGLDALRQQIFEMLDS